jgi:GntR family transcriptional regulator
VELEGKLINKNIPIPLYYQLKEILQQHIEAAHEGDFIPTEAELCEKFNISRPTVRQAISELVMEGHLYRLKGKGTFISKPKIRQDFMIVLESFSDEMKEKGLVPKTQILRFEAVSNTSVVGEMLKISKDERVVLLERLRFASDEPLVLVTTYLPESRLPNVLAKNLQDESLYRTIERGYGLAIGKAIRTLEPRIAGEYEARMLSIKKGAPIQYIETVTYLIDGAPIEFSQASYRGDRNRFSFELTKKRI